MIEQRRPQPLVAVIAVLVFIAGACGSGGDSGSTAELPAIDNSEGLPLADDQPEPDVQDLPNASEGEDRSSELVGRWEIVNYELPDGGLTNVVGNDPVFIEFGVDGSVSYNTGCNGGAAEYATSGAYVVPESGLDDTLEGQPISIGPIVEQTAEGCDGFLGEQDDDLPANMGSVTRFILRDGGGLLLLDEFMLIDTTRSG